MSTSPYNALGLIPVAANQPLDFEPRQPGKQTEYNWPDFFPLLGVLPVNIAAGQTLTSALMHGWPAQNLVGLVKATGVLTFNLYGYYDAAGTRTAFVVTGSTVSGVQKVLQPPTGVPFASWRLELVNGTGAAIPITDMFALAQA